MYELIDKIISQQIERAWECKVGRQRIIGSFSLKGDLNITIILPVKKTMGSQVNLTWPMKTYESPSFTCAQTSGDILWISDSFSKFEC